MKASETRSNPTPESDSGSPPTSTFYLLPSILLHGLRLAARQLASSLLPGTHASRQPGMAREFSQYRAYQPGDDPRHIDWKLYARSDRYFLRESEIETAISVRIILDATASMQHADSTGPAAGVSKFDFARVIAAALASLAQTQGDPAELHAVAGGRVVSVQGGRNRQPFERIVYTLERLKPSGRWPTESKTLQKALSQGASNGVSANRRGIIFVITDLHEQEDEIRAGLAALRSGGSELVLLHLLGGDETNFPFTGAVRFEDWETGDFVETDADTARVAWLGAQQERIAAWERAWPESHFEYVPVRLDEPLDRTLRGYLLRRMKR